MPEPARRRSIAALGDVMDPNCFGGAPNQFFNAAVARGFAHDAWRINPARLRRDRLRWNAIRVLSGRRPGGFQFSSAGRRATLARVDRSLLATDVISFHQHVPPYEEVDRAGGTLNFYIDATYRQLFPTYGIDRTLSESAMHRALEYEREAFRSARWIVANQGWTHRSLLDDYGIPAEKCAVILAAPNYAVYPGIRPEPKGVAGKDRPFVIGFIGKDWRRKGLKVSVETARILKRNGWKVKIQAIGFPPGDCPYSDEVDCLGFIDKRAQFGPFLHGCDIGCLFSSAEAMGSSILEFLGVGVPVAGYTVNGLNYVLPAEAGFRFPPLSGPEQIATAFDEYLHDGARQHAFRANAIDFAGLLTWRRCVDEFDELWRTGRIGSPFRLWAGA
jgi:glycosyltransferase involved in cell wall biosynthesis